MYLSKEVKLSLLKSRKQGPYYTGETPPACVV